MINRVLYTQACVDLRYGIHTGSKDLRFAENVVHYTITHCERDGILNEVIERELQGTVAKLIAGEIHGR